MNTPTHTHRTLIRAGAFGFVVTMLLLGNGWVALSLLGLYSLVTGGTEALIAAALFDVWYMPTAAAIPWYTVGVLACIILSRFIRTRLWV